MQASRRPTPAAPIDGSRTITLRDDQPRPEGEGDAPAPLRGVLKLRGGPRSRPQVQWTDDVVDNEGAGRKKSKICCIYHKPRAFDESSDESDSSSDDGSCDGHHDHNHAHGHSRHNVPVSRDGPSGSGPAGGEATRDGAGGSTTTQEVPVSRGPPNAYEVQPKPNKGKGKVD